VPDLATALRGMSALQRLNLRENELESAGAFALAPVLSSLHALQVWPLYTSMRAAHSSTTMILSKLAGQAAVCTVDLTQLCFRPVFW